MMKEELARCALLNFENVAKMIPQIKTVPYFAIAMAQLDEALGGPPAEEVLQEMGDKERRRRAADLTRPKLVSP